MKMQHLKYADLVFFISAVVVTLPQDQFMSAFPTQVKMKCKTFTFKLSKTRKKACFQIIQEVYQLH